MSYIIFILKSIVFVFAFRAITLTVSGAVDTIIKPGNKLLTNGALLFYTYLYGFFAAIWVAWMNSFESGINWRLSVIFILLTTALWIARDQSFQNAIKNNSDNAYLKDRVDSGLHRMATGMLLIALIAFSFAPNLSSYLYGNIPNKIVSGLFPIF